MEVKCKECNSTMVTKKELLVCLVCKKKVKYRIDLPHKVQIMKIPYNTFSTSTNECLERE